MLMFPFCLCLGLSAVKITATINAPRMVPRYLFNQIFKSKIFLSGIAVRGMV
jgi:hypothetical protein